MSCYSLCPKPSPLILQIPYIFKYLDVSDLILGISWMRIFVQYPINQQFVFFDGKVSQKKITTDTMILSKIAPSIAESYIFTAFGVATS